MTSIRDGWKQVEEYTTLASSRLYQAAYAGGGLLWLTRPETTPRPPVWSSALALIAAFFVVDIAQYVVGAQIRGREVRRIELHCTRDEQGRSDQDTKFDWPHWIDCPTRAIWYAKMLVLAIAYVLIGVHLFST